MITFFKELFYLIKQLFTKIEVTEINLKQMKYFPFVGYSYMMWCGELIYRNERFSKISEIDKNHEEIHIHQAIDCGKWLKYYWKYIIEYSKVCLYSTTAYYTNKYEVEAYAKENDLEYLKRRCKDNVNLFKLYNRISLFKPYRKNIKGYKNYIISLFSEI